MKRLILFLAILLLASSADAQGVFTRQRMKADSLNYGGSLPVGALRDSIRSAKDGTISALNISTTSTTPAWITNTVKNTVRSTGAQATDTSAYSFGMTASGQPQFKITSATGVKVVQIDSLGISLFKLPLHTIALGDSVFLRFIVDAADTTLKAWNGSAWITIKDLIP